MCAETELHKKEMSNDDMLLSRYLLIVLFQFSLKFFFKMRSES